MKLALVQQQVYENLSDTLNSLTRNLETAARQEADFVLLPELWHAPFSHEGIKAHQDDAKRIVPFLKRAAREHGFWIAAGTIIWPQDGKKPRNRMLVVDDNGEIVAYADKMHLLEVDLKEKSYLEADDFDSGSTFCTFSTPWCQMAACICFDIRFPELARLLCKNADLLLVPAGFNNRVGPLQFEPLMQARAIENEVFLAACNPSAKDMGTYGSWGHSLVVEPDGKIALALGGDETVQTIELNLDRAKKIRARSPYWRLRRLDLYTLETEPYEENQTE